MTRSVVWQGGERYFSTWNHRLCHHRRRREIRHGWDDLVCSSVWRCEAHWRCYSSCKKAVTSWVWGWSVRVLVYCCRHRDCDTWHCVTVCSHEGDLQCFEHQESLQIFRRRLLFFSHTWVGCARIHEKWVCASVDEQDPRTVQAPEDEIEWLDMLYGSVRDEAKLQFPNIIRKDRRLPFGSWTLSIHS